MPYLMPDTSHWQGPISDTDARKAATRCEAMQFKASEDTGFVDPTYVGNARAWRPHGTLGAYHFVGPGSAAAQANHFLAVVRQGPDVDFLLVDWEASGTATARGIVRALKKKFHGPVLLYRGSHARETDPGDTIKSDGAIVPSYGPSSLAAAYKPKHSPLVGWQYTDGKYNGTSMPRAIPGIGACDVTVVYIPRLLGDTKATHSGHDHKPPAPKPQPKRARYVVTKGDYSKSHLTFAGASADVKSHLRKVGDEAAVKKVKAG